MNDITIIKASVEDAEVLNNLGRETFYETFAEGNTEANMKKYLEENFTTEKISKELANPESQFFIVWETGIPVGFLKLNTGTAQTELQDETAIEIERIYVKRSHHGKKVGQLLYEKALEVATLKGMSAIWLGVWEENPRAIRFYEKNGFVAFSKHIFRMGNEDQTDIMMKKILH